jgi:anti-sigma factor RsiW
MTTLGCLWTRSRVERHVDGALGPWMARRVEDHLGSCADCLARAEGFRRLRSLLRASVDAVEPDWTGFWPAVHARIAAEKARPLRDAWWLPLWRPFWGHPRLALGGALAGGLALALALWPATDQSSSIAWAGPVIVQDVSAPDPDRSVMVYSSPDQALTVIWLFNSDGSADDS